MNYSKRKKLRQLLDQTPLRPWRWEGNSDVNKWYLVSVKRMKELVMDFARWGTRGAQPRFNVDGIMQKASNFIKLREEHHKSFNLDLNHPIAQLIVESINNIEELLDYVDCLEKEITRYKSALKIIAANKVPYEITDIDFVIHLAKTALEEDRENKEK